MGAEHSAIVSKSNPADWLWDIRPQAASTSATLLLLPHAGASAQAYGHWADWFPKDVRLVAFQYPGHGGRFTEQPAGNLQELAEALAGVVDQLDEPLHIFGHSLGALVGFELCHMLQSAGRPVNALYASGASAPHVHRPQPVSPTELSRSELVEVLRERGGMPAEVLENDELLDLALDICRKDMVLTHTYAYGPDIRKLDCPIIAFGGDADSVVPVARLERWPELANGVGEVRVLKGGHFYLLDHMAEIAGTIRRSLEQRQVS